MSLISHELRTPLSSILGYLELVLDDEDQHAHGRPAQVPDDGRAQRPPAAAARRRPAVHRPGRGRPVHAPARGRRPRGRGPRRRGDRSGSPRTPPGSRSASTCPTDGLVVPGDAVRLGQACDNLVSNAVKFTPSGGRVTLTLRTAWQTPDGEVTAVERPGAAPVAQLSVRDTGMGIPTGEQGKLFTRFFRASTAQRNAVPGVGLGSDHHQGHHHRARRHARRRQRRGRGHHLHDDIAALRTAPRPGAVPLAR